MATPTTPETPAVTPAAAPAEAVPMRPGCYIRDPQTGELQPDPSAELTKPAPPPKPPGAEGSAA